MLLSYPHDKQAVQQLGHNMVEAWPHLHPHLVIGGDNRAVVEVVLLYEQGDEVHVLEDQVRLSAQAEMLSLHRQQLACCFEGAHLKILAGTHLVLQHKGGFVVSAILC